MSDQSCTTNTAPVPAGKVMGLDLSLTGTGIAVISRDGSLEFHQEVGYKIPRSAKEVQRTKRLIHIATHIVNAVEKHGVTEVAIEGAAFGAFGAQFDLGQVHGIVRTQLYLAFDLQVQLIAPTSARKIVFGRGNTPKKNVPKLLTKHGYKATLTNNECDALTVALALIGRKITDHQPPQ